MKILSIRTLPVGSGNAIARLDVETPFGIRLFNLKLSRGPQGLRVYAPSAFGSSVATFTPEFAAEIIRAAQYELGDIGHGTSKAA